MTLDRLEVLLRQFGAIAGIATLAVAVAASIISLRHTPAREEPGARLVLRAPVMAVASAFFIALAILGWQTLPIEIPTSLRFTASGLGAFLLLGGAALYLWGLLSLGSMFSPSSGFGARIQAAHRLITSGPYALLRHPMYFGIIAATTGTLLLYRTWTGLVFSIAMFGLIRRARREERLLAAEFGVEWDVYASRVPMWFPGWQRSRLGGA